ncbi:ground-like domain protein [Onchocerca flexuosa]|uniref:Ground-like domain protein n=1 Tax=Onchocerca flexuosa TaxID=387005 RepID=A0A238C153_9BILA|nr:ground-like domain protein [Onchocerca flexuosa]
MIRSQRLLVLAVFLKFSVVAQASLFGGSDCCCECGIPMPPSCGCSIPICPPPVPCPPPICPVCKICASPPVCPPPPVALCPPPHPIYLPSSNCDCGAANAPAGSYASPGSAVGGYASPVPPPPLPPPPLLPAPPSSSYSSYRPNVQSAGLPTSFGVSPPSIIPNHLLEPETDAPNPSVMHQPLSVQNEVQKSDDSIFPDRDNTNQLSPLSSTTAPLTERRIHRAVIISENKCNSIVLKDLLLKNMDQTDPVISKRAIHKAAQEIMKEDEIDIICSDAGFTYIVITTEYCEAQKERVICFIYKKP